MTREYDEIILVFDTYKDVSLKHATREARLQRQHPVQYQIHDETRINHITMKRFLSHDKTKADLADYLAMKVLTYNAFTAVANHHLLFRHTSVYMVSGVNDVEPIARALGRQKANALPALHSFSEADAVGKFNQLGRATWLKIVMKSGSDTIGDLEQLLIVNKTSAQQPARLASFVCDAYCPKCIEINSIPEELRWYLFCKHVAESNRLPPTS